ncbi:hypothetical protein [Pedobacter zeae]|uniref:Shufflon protein, N-terminal constant region n=1 Tax=Pedobacter zeae TaxID=1737356 RepID=A0A7W6K6U7_9SPHI|nr:hypothetical protein [Pedobacter zeae]MBB4106274.1 hypothetical protein [Pedobacter zeae]GGH00640.1 hypothetical protein GCM10007422_14030 [Pedobacter zeae]
MKLKLLPLLVLLLPICTFSQTIFRNDAGQANVNAGFYEASEPVNFPAGASSWWHLLDVRHSNGANNFAMQLAGSFFDQNFYLRKTNNYAQQPWVKIVTESNGKVGIGTTVPQVPLHVMGRGLFESNLKIMAAEENWAEGLTIIRPNGWSGLRFTRNDPGTGNFEGNWALGYSGLTGNDFTISHQTGGIQHDALFHIRSDNQFVGIGTASPQAKLDVKGGALVLGSHVLSHNTDGYMSLGNILENSSPTLQEWVSKTTLLLNAQDYASIGFHDSGNRVDFIRAGNGLIDLGYDGGFGKANIGLPNGIWSAAGNLGIGTTSPYGKLHIVDAGVSKNAGNENPITSGGLVIQANTGGRSQINGAQLEFAIPANTDGNNIYSQGRIITVAANDQSYNATGRMILGTRRMFDKNGSGQQWYYGDDITIDGSGYVGIGINNPSEKFTVNGKIKAKEIRVDGAGTPDYVFEEDYKNLSLKEIEQYIKKNKHLPEIPSASEAAENGIALGEMNKLLLKKIEELTLHLIEKDKALSDVQERLLKLEKGNK